MPRLYTYTIPIDDGAAPNPFGGICTLAICKPAIRRTAQIGDWIVGLGSRNAPSGNLSRKVVYAMRVTEKITLREYDQFARERWPHKIPDLNSRDLSEKLGDCIYDYDSPDNPAQRVGVHGPRNVQTDLSGENVLISDHFHYWGREAIPLHSDLHPILHQNQGHKVGVNAPYYERFTTWIEELNVEVGQHGWPDYPVDWTQPLSACHGCTTRKIEADADKEEEG